ncbi:MAG: hypothetical protein KatS3mg011_1124 [Acidimicrobiia bacterium]|nr:MAG: hypothetical protein KatS3mg011_1124 [Acidimicrobiia bacterium]
MAVSELRWRSSAQPGLFELGRRVAGRGEYRGLTFWEVEARTIINRVPNRGSLPFEFTINAYRGCSHGCIYCFARPTHTYLGFEEPEEFDTEIVVKVNAVELVEAETRPGRWGGHPIAMGTNTDPYQPAEGRYKLTRGIVEVLVERRNPFSILTKSTLALRDLDLFVEAARRTTVSVDFSVGTLDEEVWRQTEPNTPHPGKRLEAVARLNQAGVPSGVLVAPILPGLSEDGVDEVIAAARRAGATHVYPIMLHLRPGVKEHYMGWLERNHPELAEQYRELYADRSRLRPRNRRRRDTRTNRQVPRPAQLELPFSLPESRRRTST